MEYIVDRKGWNSTEEFKGALVRCRDCKWYETKFCVMDVWTDEVTIHKAGPTDYCSKGEKK